MIVKSKEPLFCRCCGRGIRKWTKTVYVRAIEGKFDRNVSYARYTYIGLTPIKTIAEARRLSNLVVVSVKRGRFALPGVKRKLDEPLGSVSAPGGQIWEVEITDGVDDCIVSFQEWDGESYDDLYFDTNKCAIEFGRAMANFGGQAYGTKAWRDATAKQKERAK